MSEILKHKTNKLIVHPAGGLVFGIVPPIQRLALEQGNIYLRAGMHRVHRGQSAVGFGVRHIWEGKKQELKKRGVLVADDIPGFITTLVRRGTEVYHDPDHPRASMKRITLLRTRDGTLLLEPRRADRHLGFHYQVITWTPRALPKGIKVGVIEFEPAQ